jgi:hypothetical protein
VFLLGTFDLNSEGTVLWLVLLEVCLREFRAAVVHDKQEFTEVVDLPVFDITCVKDLVQIFDNPTRVGL